MNDRRYHVAIRNGVNGPGAYVQELASGDGKYSYFGAIEEARVQNQLQLDVALAALRDAEKIVARMRKRCEEVFFIAQEQSDGS